MRIVKFDVPGKPRAKQRPRMCKSGIVFTPKETVAYENWVRICYQRIDTLGVKMNGPLQAEIEVNCPIAKSWSKGKREAALANTIYPTTKPDLDNVAKAILDSLNGIAYDDDKQIAVLIIKRRFAENESVVVTLMTLDIHA